MARGNESMVASDAGAATPVQLAGSTSRVATLVPSALFEADGAAMRWTPGGSLRQERSVSDAIARFSPREVPRDLWDRIVGPVRTWAGMAPSCDAAEAGALMTVLTQLAVWADTLGLPLSPDALFHPDTIDRFAREGCSHLAAGTQLNYRRQLRSVARAVMGPDHFPPPPLSLKKSHTRGPYSKAEVAALAAWCRGLSTERYRVNAGVMLAFGLGAGLRSQELSDLVGSDVGSDGAGVVVHVGRGASRSIPVVDRWADQVLAHARRAGEGPIFVPGGNGIHRRQVANFIARCPKDDGPGLAMDRLRITWMVDHLSAGTHLVVLAKAAGVAASQIVRYLPYADVPDPIVAQAMLRGVGPP
jgi:integrase